MYRLSRVFCATSWELEGERRAFQDVVGKVNESHAMPLGRLYVPASTKNFTDKRPLQFTIEENIRDASYYILALTEGWGPPARNFERDYRLALQCLADPALPMQRVVLLLRREPACPESFVEQARALGPVTGFDTVSDFDRIVTALLVEWLSSDGQ